MVSFSCEACGDVLTKKKLDPHRNRCQGATFTCIDCMVHFPGTQYRSHTSCMTEDQKYQGALYKEKNKKPRTQNTPNNQRNEQTNKMAQPAYVEDFDETWREYQGPTDDERSPAEPPPEAPTPPAAADDDHVNVFDFLVATGQTPNASSLNLAQPQGADESKSLVRYEHTTEDYFDPNSFMDDDKPLVQYGRGPYDTPVPTTKTDRRKEHKSDKKRKRLHVEVRDDVKMTDAPPPGLQHSGLTGGIKAMMPLLPPSPDYSGGDGADPHPASPLKKTKHSKHSKSSQGSNSLFGMLAGPTKTKTKKRKTSKKHSSKHREKSPKLIEYRPRSKDGKDSQDGQMVVFKPRADVFFNFVNKGPESERGCSMNKALKRFHRERQAAGTDMSKHMEEKELWRSIRLRRNDRGEIVLFAP